MIPEAEQIQLQRLALHHNLPRHVGNVQGRKVRLSGDRTKAGKLRTVELDEIVPIRMLVRKCFQHLRCIVAGILRILIAQQSNISVSSLLLPAISFTSQCRIRHTVCRKCCCTVAAGTADTAGLFAALVAAPCQCIGHAQFQSFFYHVCLCPLDKGASIRSCSPLPR